MISKKNCLRRMCFRMTSWRFFDNAILLVIVMSSLNLAISTYDHTEEGQENHNDLFTFVTYS